MPVGYVATDLADLRTADVSGITAPNTVAFLVAGKRQWYAYDPDSTLSDNNEWIIEPSAGNGDGAWYPIGIIRGNSTPSGACDQPVDYIRVQISSSGVSAERLYSNVGGGSSDWNRVNYT